MSAALKQASQMKIQMSVVSGPHAGQTFTFSKPTLTIGRGPENDVVLVNDPLVSRMHARLEFNNNGEFDLINLSQKNGIMIQGDYVDKWRLINDSTFQIGDSEFKFQFDLGHAVVSVSPPVRSSANLSVAKVAEGSYKPPVSVKKPQPTQAVAPRQAAMQQQPQGMQLHSMQNQQPIKTAPGFAQPGYAQARAVDEQAAKNKKIRFYAIVAIIGLGFAYFILNPKVAQKPKRPKAVLKYEDEIQFSQNSKAEKELQSKREEDKKAKFSPTNLRAEENFIKGMRDFQLGNYARAQEFFQVVLNLIPDHALARRHLYLAKIRFDELVQAKLVLGESNYQKHNFDMCQSMYQQVMDMLQNKSSDQKYQLAQKMFEKCQLGSEGIR